MQARSPVRTLPSGYAWDVLRRDPGVREKVNRWLDDENKLSTPYEVRIDHLHKLKDVFADLDVKIEKMREQHYGALDNNETVSAWEVYEGLDEIVQNAQMVGTDNSSLQELSLVDRRTQTEVSHRDVGIGISQVLPVLVSCYGHRDQIIAIEQPEIHLHPALQAELGDVFIQSALGEQGNTFILETHSEHLILRIMRRIRDTANEKQPADVPRVRPEDVSVLFIEPTKTGSVIRVLELDEEGEFLDPWPGGFFEEGFRERFT